MRRALLTLLVFVVLAGCTVERMIVVDVCVYLDTMTVGDSLAITARPDRCP